MPRDGKSPVTRDILKITQIILHCRLSLAKKNQSHLLHSLNCRQAFCCKDYCYCFSWLWSESIGWKLYLTCVLPRSGSCSLFICNFPISTEKLKFILTPEIDFFFLFFCAWHQCFNHLPCFSNLLYLVVWMIWPLLFCWYLARRTMSKMLVSIALWVLFLSIKAYLTSLCI